MPDLVRQLSERKFGHVVRIGDAFCGGGSVPFEAARLGCDAYGSDLNPVSALLTWAAINIVGGGEQDATHVRQTQGEIFAAVDRQITKWRIEHNDVGWRPEAFLYCTESTCPECGWHVPLAPSWIVGEKPATIAQLIAEPAEKAFSIDIRSDVDDATLQIADEAGTVKDHRLHCPNPECTPNGSSSIAAIRGDEKSTDGNGIRPWQSEEFAPCQDDVFAERLYCVRWRLPSLEALLRMEQCKDASRSLARSETPQSPIPEWVDLDQALQALSHWLGPDQQQELRRLRDRDWLAEDQAFEHA